LGRRLEEARLVFEKMFSYAGGQLGNFPQAFSHLSLISAAINLNHQLDHGPGTI
jgi:GH15 family glucan-1,4-alpha-glucosidase